MSFTLHDLGTAYRKAELDLNYSSQASLPAIADYEERLGDHLEVLQGKLTGKDENWILKVHYPKFDTALKKIPGLSAKVS